MKNKLGSSSSQEVEQFTKKKIRAIMIISLAVLLFVVLIILSVGWSSDDTEASKVARIGIAGVFKTDGSPVSNLVLPTKLFPVKDNNSGEYVIRLQNYASSPSTKNIEIHWYLADSSRYKVVCDPNCRITTTNRVVIPDDRGYRKTILPAGDTHIDVPVSFEDLDPGQIGQARIFMLGGSDYWSAGFTDVYIRSVGGPVSGETDMYNVGVKPVHKKIHEGASAEFKVTLIFSSNSRCDSLLYY